MGIFGVDLMKGANDIAGMQQDALAAQEKMAQASLMYQNEATQVNTKTKTESDTLQSEQSISNACSDASKYQ
ncbi:hypothetical protein [Burkholderia diffusa]|uniref:hypothetical protein n=1 Tax=Burkholderia diffusa TaxID=488732 RepID=UPI000755F28C|nr:hypothetical protein [Burkholderia diffusa]KVN02921.1 hypothetical protein WJ62_11965 [Burkholderia diffusa]